MGLSKTRAKRFSAAVATWVKYTGIDGFRIDTAKHVRELPDRRSHRHLRHPRDR
ncbi:alpha-amylase family glycosyl hydrolase [Nonomuraea sp. 3N208]|uniref:alpha-amylase family glycosyl hydrolase n=1 Tax=Nonomuraea sp. 3N208 TaxID=3457421 RepID=UPI003FCF7932